MSQKDTEADRLMTLSALRSIVTATYERTTPIQRGLAFWLVPVALLLVGAFPEPLQAKWTLEIDDPTMVQVYLSNFVHSDIQHLSNNVLSYLFVMCVLLPLAALTRRLRMLGILSVLLLTVLPIVVSLYSITALSGTVAERVSGFSGVVMGYLGTLPIFIALLIQKRVHTVNVPLGAAGLMAVELGVVLWLSGLHRWSLLLLTGLGIVAILFAWFAGERETRGVRHYELQNLVSAAIVFVSLPIPLIATADVGTNVFGHLIGLIGGFLVALGLVLVRPIVSDQFSFWSGA